MKYFCYILLVLISYSCSFNTKEINSLDFPYSKEYQASYSTRSTLFNEDASIRTAQSDTLYFKVSKDVSAGATRSFEWLLLPGSIDKKIPDTILSVIDSTGLYHYYSPELLPEGAKEIHLISLPLTPKKVWKSNYLSFPAKATFVNSDTTINTPAGIFQAFGIQYEFAPFYMDDFIKDKNKQEVRAVLVDYYSQEAGKVLTLMNYYVTDKKSGEKLWRILSNESILVQLKLK